MTLRVNTITSGLDANQTHVLVLDKRMEDANRVGSTTNAGNDSVRKLALLLVQLLLDLLADDRLEVAHDRGERMRTNGRTDNVVRVVQRLTTHILGAHVDDTLHAELGTRRGSGHAVLTGTGLGDDSGLAESAGEQDLADGVVDLVRAGVVEVLPLEPDLRTAGGLGHAVGRVELAGAADVLVVALELLPELGVLERGEIGLLELLVGVEESLGDVLTAELAETRRTHLALGVDDGVEARHGWPVGGDDGVDLGHGDRVGLVHDLLDVERLLALDAALVLAGDLGAVGTHRLDTSGRVCGRILELGDDLASDDDAVGVLADLDKVLPCGHTEADGERDGGDAANAGDEVGQGGGDGGGGAGGAHLGDDVDERVCERGEVLDALGRGGRGDERHVREAVLGAGASEVDGLLGRQVDDDEAVGTGSLGILNRLVLSVGERWVVVAHEQNGGLEALGACLTDVVEALGVADALLQRDLVALLDGGAVSLGIGEGDAELDDVCAALLEAEEDIDGVVLGGEAGGDEADEDGLVLGGLGGEGGFDLVGHGVRNAVEARGDGEVADGDASCRRDKRRGAARDEMMRQGRVTANGRGDEGVARVLMMKVDVGWEGECGTSVSLGRGSIQASRGRPVRPHSCDCAWAVGKRAALASSSGGGEQLHLRFTSSQATAARLALSLSRQHTAVSAVTAVVYWISKNCPTARVESSRPTAVPFDNPASEFRTPAVAAAAVTRLE
ncbi:hypothetical protein L1887_51984 [Cichorium endivia]|nr:hypothetical protein L1887_51984 [Cichorium endivia]